jgi:hypothetical protein
MQAKVGGMGTYLGFDYSCLPFIFKLYEIPEAEWEYYIDKFHVITRIAMKHWNKRDDEGDSAKK